MLWTHIYSLYPDFASYPTYICSLEQITPLSPPTSSLWSSLLSLLMNLPFPGTSCKWHLTLFVFLCLPDVIKHNGFSRSIPAVAYFKIEFLFLVEQHSTMCRHLILFIHSSRNRLWVGFHLLATVNNTAMNTSVQIAVTYSNGSTQYSGLVKTHSLSQHTEWIWM